MSDEAYWRHARARDAQRYATTLMLNPRPNSVGMVGERKLPERYGREQDLRDRPGGDGGADLELLLDLGLADWFVADAKSTDKLRWKNKLPVQCSKIKPRIIYVRCFVTDVDAIEGELVGWEWGADLMLLPPVELLSGMNHVGEKLRPMAELDAIVRGARWSERWQTSRGRVIQFAR